MVTTSGKTIEPRMPEDIPQKPVLNPDEKRLKHILKARMCAEFAYFLAIAGAVYYMTGRASTLSIGILLLYTFPVAAISFITSIVFLVLSKTFDMPAILLLILDILVYVILWFLDPSSGYYPTQTFMPAIATVIATGAIFALYATTFKEKSEHFDLGEYFLPAILAAAIFILIFCL